MPKESVSSDLSSATVGLPVVFQQTPRFEQFSKVSAIVPCPVAVVSPMLETA
ncbi:hypothetical protein ES708_32573 [subsurface metagenome]